MTRKQLGVVVLHGSAVATALGHKHEQAADCFAKWHCTAVGRACIQQMVKLHEEDVGLFRTQRLGMRHGCVLPTEVRTPVQPGTRCMQAVSRASARGIAGRMVVSRRANIDCPTPGGLRSKTLGLACLHPL
jgi:hypothetical protein